LAGTIILIISTWGNPNIACMPYKGEERQGSY
jgi:hypothetical protein